jgi:hypothetical protein
VAIDTNGAAADRDEAMRLWFGYGRWDAPYWFIGMEPGGEDAPELYLAWKAAGGASLVDAAVNEAAWNERVSADLRTHYFSPGGTIQRSTWQPLIHILLGFTGDTDDPHEYQWKRFGRTTDGETAVIELAAGAAKNLSIATDREEHRAERIERISKELQNHAPRFALFYGLSYSDDYEKIAGGTFDPDGFRWSGKTLCALTGHPARPTKTYAYWTEYGKKLRARFDSGA